ncbi:hypothetical protein KXD40_005886 [Peronospora effusa]|nr:hypothetical protein KXD40_005886 [Peronospora effusa]
MDPDLKLALPSGHTLETLTSGAKADKNANNLPKSAALTSGDGVEKNLKLSLAPPSENTVEELTTGNGVNINLEFNLAPSSGNTLEEFTTGAKADKNANNLPKSAALTTGDVVNKNFKISLALSSCFTDQKLTAGAKVDKNANILLKSAALTTGDGVGKNKEILDEGANIIANFAWKNCYSLAKRM